MPTRSDRSLLHVAAARAVPAREQQCALFREGIERIRVLADTAPVDWQATTPCAPWRARDLVAHLRCTAEESYETLSRLLTGEPPAEVLSERALAAHNERALAALPTTDGREHLARFIKAADDYLALAEGAPGLWEQPAYTYRGEAWSVGHEVGVLAVEWQVHAWDLAVSWGTTHRPTSPWQLARAFGAGMAYLSLAAGPDPWEAVLTASGRRAG
ncbi:maleylpyruvate isomerase N-terminal domain-containing protein [Streptomyces sp. NPDC046805]|uniref:maleylpyruvate isomerase N-terminal domain-containing protein n=1 Tax=Streptomyces sp. NPDC046805 TaxID=3155134 RepID=UPI0033F47618